MRLFELEELLSCACGLTEGEYEKLVNDCEDLDALCFEKFNCDVDDFYKIAESLLVLTPKIETAITKEVVHAFISGDRIIIKGRSRR